MRVLLAIHGLPFGGAEVMVRNLALALSKAGSEVLVMSLTSADTPVADTLRARGIRVIGLNKRKGLDLALVPRIWRTIRTFRPHVIHTHLPVLHYVWPGSWLNRSVRVVHTFHSLATSETRSPLIRAVNRLALTVGGVTPVALTEAGAETIHTMYSLSNDEIQVIPNGVPIEDYVDISDGRVASDTFRVLHVGRLHPAKNQMRLLTIFASLVSSSPMPARLTILGEGDEKEHLLSECVRLGIGDHVVFVGAQEDPRPYYMDADVFVLPSRYEAFPMTLIEAMASGLPVVCSNLSTLAELVTHGENGYLEDPDSDLFVARLVELANDGDWRLLMGQKAEQAASVRSAALMAERYLRAYE